MPRITRRGFSLIEVLVVIGVIAVLIAIALPALWRARGGARQARALANLRSTHALFDQYHADWRVYPFRAPGTTPAIMDEPVDPGSLAAEWYPGGFIIATGNHWEHSTMWPALVAPLEDWPGLIRTWVSPGREARLPPREDYFSPEIMLMASHLISIRYSNAFVARPELWGGSGVAPDERAVLRPTSAHEVRHPAQKVLLWDTHAAYVRPEPEIVDRHIDAKTAMAFADGHASAHNPQDASEPADNPLRGNAIKIHDTRDGVRGIDYD